MRNIFVQAFCYITVCLFFSCKFHHQEYDKIIRNGMIYDGNGGEPYKADIGIRTDTIAFIGDLAGVSARISIDARGMAVAPGFIDTHSHYGGDLFNHRDFLAAVSQGITTVISGQDGSSSFPLTKFYKELADTPVAVNIASYSGHNTLRDSILGKDFKRLPQLQKLKR